MRIAILKFGGTSLSSTGARLSAIRHIRCALDQSLRVVVVVSAMGRKGDPYATDTLLAWIGKNGDCLPAREKDLLLSCGEIISAATLCSMLRQSGIEAAALTGGQAGIVTNDKFGDARIVTIHTQPLLRLLESGRVAVVAGFQGQTRQGETTTLGRGGSDTTAVALGAALGAEYVDVFTDVAGVFTADPRIVQNARPLMKISYAEISQMALSGAKVIHPRAVEMAMLSKVPLRVRSTFSAGDGTWISAPSDPPASAARIQDVCVTAIANSGGATQIRISGDKTRYDLHLEVFKAMAEHEISVDFINVNPSGIIYTVGDGEADKAAGILRKLGLMPQLSRKCAKISVIGGGMNEVPGVMAKIVETLTALDISILQSADSHSSIRVLVHERHMKRAVTALHDAFELAKLSE